MNDNRLGRAVSPYLLQHAANPVDWREWGPEAFAEARERDVPVFVSIGYATCHWCHVMARESFSDPSIAELLRDGVVAVKVDREERPDVDASIMAAASAFTTQLGWPLSAFMTPDAHVFFAGTYYPPRPVQQHPSFRQIVEAVLDAWRNRRSEVDANASAIATAIRQGAEADADARRTADEGGRVALPPVDAIRGVVEQLAQAEDAAFGGFGGAPKFPSAPLLEFLDDLHRDGVDLAGGLVTRTLDAIAGSELTDADGGVFRYATKRDWSVPHYERMLYDNAGLLAVAGGSQARGIASFLEHTLRTADGAFVAAQDSESTIDGHRVEGEWYRRPLAERGELDPPPLDDQVLAGWNGLAIRGLALAGARTDDPELVALARGAADAVVSGHVRDGHLVVRTRTPRGDSTAGPTMEDSGLLADGLLELALVTGDPAYAVVARVLVADGFAALRTPQAPGTDPVLAAAGTATGEQPQTALRSGTVALATAAVTLGVLSGDDRDRDAAVALVAERARTGVDRPLGHADALGLALAVQRPSREIVVVAASDDPVGAEMRLRARAARRPGTVVATVTPEQARAWADAGFALFDGRDGAAPVAYVCHDRVCALPARDADGLQAQLDEP